MTPTIDLNCDLGESGDEAAITRDVEIMNLVSSVNIACGGHAGDETIMSVMLRAARQRQVSVGAHPSYPDRENFGRHSMIIAHDRLLAELISQIDMLACIAAAENTRIAHVKPHGALYNDAADDSALAMVIANAAADRLPDSALVGLAGGAMEQAAQNAGLRFVGEAFVDRRYDNRSRLVSRQQEGAVIADKNLRVQQAVALAKGQSVMTIDGKPLTIKADTLCLHSDSDGALESARLIRLALESANITIKAANGS